MNKAFIIIVILTCLNQLLQHLAAQLMTSSLSGCSTGLAKSFPEFSRDECDFLFKPGFLGVVPSQLLIVQCFAEVVFKA